MGVNTNAMLVFGVPLVEDAIPEYDEDVDDDQNNALASMRHFGEVDDGIMVKSHCSGSCPMHLLVVEGMSYTASRGHPVRIEALDAPAPEQLARLDAFIAKHELRDRVDGEPGWYLASWWSS